MWGLGRRCSAALVCVVMVGCSFTNAVVKSDHSVHESDEIVDSIFTAVAGAGCVVAAIALSSPDSFAPVQDDPTSWKSPQDRADVIAQGRDWTPIACITATAFLASGLYGHFEKVDPDSTWSPGTGAAFGAGLAGFAAGFNAARTQTSTPASVPMPEVEQSGCVDDFGCGMGRRCVKRQYASYGVCIRTVDDVGAPTFDSPNLDSIGPKLPSSSDCTIDADCRAGFRCDATSGACIR